MEPSAPNLNWSVKVKKPGMELSADRRTVRGKEVTCLTQQGIPRIHEKSAVTLTLTLPAKCKASAFGLITTNKINEQQV